MVQCGAVFELYKLEWNRIEEKRASQQFVSRFNYTQFQPLLQSVARSVNACP